MKRISAVSGMRKGFTLVEVLVTIAIISVLAGVLLPALFKQIGRGDTGRLAEDLSNLRTGVETFGTDTHRLPLKISHLHTAISTTDADINGNLYPAGIVAKWHGPYVSRDRVTSTGGGTFTDTFVITTGDAGGRYLSVNVSAMTAQDFAQIEAILDEGTATTTTSTAGVARYSSTNSTLTFLMIPIQ